MFLKLEYKRLQENRFDTIYTDQVDCKSYNIFVEYKIVKKSMLQISAEPDNLQKTISYA